ncbi:hypothetical protein TNCT_247891 [Trichonephila clavata]|uniref:Uncharacterized protein n=1 Tax=Trichonephila clavata TaxID=2740835 RepID=A0A8X6HLE8_TRICU|nr:hypothetical protein TNCT_247891 [Trichonephila clavata]
MYDTILELREGTESEIPLKNLFFGKISIRCKHKLKLFSVFATVEEKILSVLQYCDIVEQKASLTAGRDFSSIPASLFRVLQHRFQKQNKRILTAKGLCLG